MYVGAMVVEVRGVADTMVSKSSLPDFTLSVELYSQRVRISSLDVLDRAFQSNAGRRG
jgi:hypothetical protein